MSKLNLMGVGILIGFGMMAAAPAIAQKSQPGDAKQVYEAIDCKQWTHNDDGTWTGGPKARVGSLDFPNTINNTMKGYVDNGVDAEAALLRKCGRR